MESLKAKSRHKKNWKSRKKKQKMKRRKVAKRRRQKKRKQQQKRRKRKKKFIWNSNLILFANNRAESIFFCFSFSSYQCIWKLYRNVFVRCGGFIRIIYFCVRKEYKRKEMEIKNQEAENFFIPIAI